MKTEAYYWSMFFTNNMLSNIQHNQGNSHWQKEEREQNFAFLLWVLGFVGVLNYHLSNFDPTLPLGHLAEKKKI